MNSIIEVTEQHYGVCELDVSRIIALVPEKRLLLFERAYWELQESDFNKVSELWHILKRV